LRKCFHTEESVIPLSKPGWLIKYRGSTAYLYNSFLQKHNYNAQVKEDEMGRACSTNGAKRNAYRILVAKPGGNRPLGRPRRRWVDNIKMDLREIGWGGMDFIDLAGDRDQ
jgi:hypothetical protein